MTKLCVLLRIDNPTSISNKYLKYNISVACSPIPKTIPQYNMELKFIIGDNFLNLAI